MNSKWKSKNSKPNNSLKVPELINIYQLGYDIGYYKNLSFKRKLSENIRTNIINFARKTPDNRVLYLLAFSMYIRYLKEAIDKLRKTNRTDLYRVSKIINDVHISKGKWVKWGALCENSIRDERVEILEYYMNTLILHVHSFEATTFFLANP